MERVKKRTSKSAVFDSFLVVSSSSLQFHLPLNHEISYLRFSVHQKFLNRTISHCYNQRPRHGRKRVPRLARYKNVPGQTSQKGCRREEDGLGWWTRRQENGYRARTRKARGRLVVWSQEEQGERKKVIFRRLVTSAINGIRGFEVLIHLKPIISVRLSS